MYFEWREIYIYINKKIKDLIIFSLDFPSLMDIIFFCLTMLYHIAFPPPANKSNFSLEKSQFHCYAGRMTEWMGSNDERGRRKEAPLPSSEQIWINKLRK